MADELYVIFDYSESKIKNNIYDFYIKIQDGKLCGGAFHCSSTLSTRKKSNIMILLKKNNE